MGSRPESSPYLKEEVLLISIPLGHPLYDLDLVVDSLEHTGMNGIAAVGQDAGKPSFKHPGEPLQRLDLGIYSPAVPAPEEALSMIGAAVSEEAL